MNEYEKIAKSMEKFFRKEGVKCDRCGKGGIKFDTIWFDNINTEPIRGTCRKCGFWFFDPVSAGIAMKEVKIAYAYNKKIREELLDYLKKGIKGCKKIKKE